MKIVFKNSIIWKKIHFKIIFIKKNNKNTLRNVQIKKVCFFYIIRMINNFKSGLSDCYFYVPLISNYNDIFSLNVLLQFCFIHMIYYYILKNSQRIVYCVYII